MIDPVDAVSARSARIFVSYARADVAFADQLATALTIRGYDVLIDHQSLPSLEDWRRELLVLIRKADTVVFIVSPSSVASAVCKWEVDQMAVLKKRLAPVVFERVANDSVPTDITKINYLFFDPPNDFEAQADALARALSTDVAWWHEHTRLVELAGRWEHDGRPESHLLRSGAITVAQSWASRRPDRAQIPEVLFELLDASLGKEQHDREELTKREHRISQRNQHVIALEAARAQEKRRHTSSMRLALAGEPTDDELARGILPEQNRRARLAAAAHASLNVACLTGHSARISRASFSPDGSRIVTVSADTTARLWHTTSGAEIAKLPHEDAVGIGIFSPDGSKLATATFNAVRIWDGHTGAERGFSVGGGWILSANFSPDSSKLLFTSQSGQLSIFDFRTGTVKSPFRGERFYRAAYSPDGKYLLACSNTEMQLWRLPSMEFVTAFPRKGMLYDVDFSADGTKLLTASDFSAWQWDTATGAELGHVTHKHTVHSAKFCLDGSRILTASSDGTSRLWNAATGLEILRIDHNESVVSAEFSPCGRLAVTASNDGLGRLWHLASSIELARYAHNAPVSSASFSADGGHVITASADGCARLWEVASTAEIYRFGTGNRYGSQGSSAAFSPDGTQVLTAFNGARLWDVESGVERAKFSHDGEVVHGAFSRDGNRIVTASMDGTARLWDPVSGKEHARFAHAGFVKCAKFSPDGTRIVTATSDRQRLDPGYDWITVAEDHAAHIWDIASGSKALSLVHDDGLSWASFSPNGVLVITASWDKTARIWDAITGKELTRFPHESGVSCAAISANGSLLLTASSKTARLWNLDTCAELARFAHDDDVNGASFNPDGRRIVTSSRDKSVRLWDVATLTELARFDHDDEVRCAEFNADSSILVTACETSNSAARLWSVIWLANLHGESLARAVAKSRLVGESCLTDGETRFLHPLLGDTISDVTSRWLTPSTDEANINSAIAQWRRHRVMALALARNDWTVRAK